MTDPNQFFYTTGVPGQQPQHNYLIINMSDPADPFAPPAPPQPPRKRERSLTEIWALAYLFLAVSVCCGCGTLASFYMAMAMPTQ